MEDYAESGHHEDYTGATVADKRQGDAFERQESDHGAHIDNSLGA